MSLAARLVRSIVLAFSHFSDVRFVFCIFPFLVSSPFSDLLFLFVAVIVDLCIFAVSACSSFCICSFGVAVVAFVPAIFVCLLYRCCRSFCGLCLLFVVLASVFVRCCFRFVLLCCNFDFHLFVSCFYFW